MTFNIPTPEMIADVRQFDLRKASRLAGIALKKDAHFDEKLLEFVNGPAASPEQAVRILDVLQSVCAEERLFGHLCALHHPDPRVRSKVALIVGRLMHDGSWLRWQLADRDPRVRANAVEGWSGWLADAASILMEAAHDPHHRVAANAALALHTLGNPAGARILFSLLRHEDEMFRRAALWAAGKSGDGRFAAEAEAIAARATGEEKKTAEQVAAQLRDRRAADYFFSARRVQISEVTALDDGRRMARIHCFPSGSDKWLAPPMLSTLDFVVTEGGRPIEEYDVRWPEDAERLTTAIAAPAQAGLFPGLLQCLQLGDARESLAFVPYGPGESGRTKGLSLVSPLELRFWIGSELAGLHLGVLNRAAMDAAGRNLDQAIAAGLSALGARPGRRHLFVAAGPWLKTALDPQALAVAKQEGVVVHAVVSSLADTQALESIRQLTQATGGQFLSAETIEPLPDLISSVRAAHFGSFEITWRTHDTGTRAPIGVACGSGYAEWPISSLRATVDELEAVHS